MAAFDLALARVQQDGIELLPDRINRLARAQDHTFRQTVLTPGNTLCWFVRQIAHGNVACSAMGHLTGCDFSDSAWCQARARLPMELIQSVHRLLVENTRRELNLSDDVGGEAYRWHGHRVHVIDGTNDSMPDTHGHLQAGDVLLGDDSFSGWGHLALLLQANLHGVMPTHHKRIVQFAPDRPHAHPRKGKSSKRAGKPRSRVLRMLGQDDQLVEYFKPVAKPAWMSDGQWKQLPDAITVREIRRTVKRNGFRSITVTIVTTLLDPEAYPADELIELRLSRWMIETNIRHLKITLGMDTLKCKTLDGVRKERRVFLLVYNLIRLIMLRSARRQGVNVNRLSFADTLAWVRFGNLDEPPEIKVNPWRPGRLEPRVLKRQKKEFPYMTSPRAKLKSQLHAKYHDTT